MRRFVLISALALSSFWTVGASAGMMCRYAENFGGNCDICNWGCAMEMLFSLGWMD